MSEAQHLAEALVALFTHTDNGWFAPYTEVVAGLSAAQAGTVPAPGFNSVWAVTNHIWYWQEIVYLPLRGLPEDRKAMGDEIGWPPAGSPDDEADWLAAVERVVQQNRDMADLVARLSDEELAQPMFPGRANGYQAIQGVIAHNSYHICEAISIRHMLGLWLERV
jgi:hypothetical protein